MGCSRCQRSHFVKNGLSTKSNTMNVKNTTISGPQNIQRHIYRRFSLLSWILSQKLFVLNPRTILRLNMPLEFTSPTSITIHQESLCHF